MFTEEDLRKNFKTLHSIRIPRPLRVIAFLLALTGISTVLFLIFVPWVQTTEGAGVVTSLNPNDRLQEIHALVPGRIAEWYVRDASRVKKGDPIVRIVDNDPMFLERLQAERGQMQSKLTAASSAAKTAEIDFNRTRKLFDDGLASRREFELASIKLQTLRSKEAEAAAALNRIDVRLSRQSIQIVRAPRDGMILRIYAGDAATIVDAGDLIANFIPDNATRAVELFIDGRDIGLVTEDAPVRLQFEGWPAIQFSGWPSIAIGLFHGRVVAVDPSADSSGRFRVLVKEDETSPIGWPDEAFIRFGALARGWVLLNTVPVGYELWRQLNNFPPEITEDRSQKLKLMKK